MIFLDTANIEEIKKYLPYGIIKGVTTNQKIFLEEKGTNHIERIKEILSIVVGPVSVELTKTNEEDLINEALQYKEIEKKFSTTKRSDIIVIKVPMWGDGKGLRVAKNLLDKGIPVNMTCIMNFNQALLACELGVNYASFFYNRMLDYKKEHEVKCIILKENIAKTFVQREILLTRFLIDKMDLKTRIICGSIRNVEDVKECFRAGAHIVTIPPKILDQMPLHPKTEETISEFDECWRKFQESEKK